MAKKWIAILLAAAVLTAADFCYCAAADDLELSAQCAALYCADNGAFLYEKNADEERSMASTTKIMTALLACESGRLAEEFTVTAEMAQIEGSSMGLLEGDRVTLRTLVYGMLLPSGNDAANTVSIILDGDSKSFAARMNRRAQALGLRHTHFENPSGLTEEGHYSTAHDMALLASAALQNDVFSSICSQDTAVVYYGNPPYRRVLSNHNRLLGDYDGMTGIKTGFTKAAGRCFVSSAVRDGVTLIAVTLNDPDDWNDHEKLLDYGFSICRPVVESVCLTGVQIPVTGGQTGFVAVGASRDITLTDTGDGTALRYEILRYPFVYAPVSRGDIVAHAAVYDGDHYLETVPLLAETDCPLPDAAPKKRSLIDAVRRFFAGLRERRQK